jgi:hypothetical protein
VEKDEIIIEHIAGTANGADGLTKPLGPDLSGLRTSYRDRTGGYGLIRRPAAPRRKIRYLRVLGSTD